jgi:TolB-like protein/Tfp pilus assembly protein PilF
MSPAKDQEYFADGMAEEIINALSKAEGLRVAARTSAFAFKGKKQDIREIGRQLDVGTVVEGSVRKEGNRLRITAQLIRAADGFHIWSQTYDRNLDDVFAIQSEIAQAVTGALRIKLRANTEIRQPSTRSLAAYDDYLRGRQHLYAYTEGGTRKAIEYFERALEKDPEFARAHAGIADAYTLWYGFGLFSPEESRIRSTSAARRALKLAPDLAEAHMSMGFVQLAHEWDFEAADRSWRRAMELAPSMVEPRLWHVVVYLGLTGRIEEALREMPGVLALDPLSPMVQTNAAVLLYFARRYDEAASKLEELLKQQPDYQYARLMLARTYIQQRRYREAARELEDWLARRGDPVTYGGVFTVPPSALLGYVDALTERRAEALDLLRDLDLRSRSGGAWPLGVAVIYMGLGDLDRAFAWMDRAVEGHRVDQWVKVDPLYDSIRSDPRYDDLLRRLGFPES